MPEPNGYSRKSRDRKRLDEECRKNPFDSGLLLQKHLLSNAKICTIDAFCIDLVRENFDKLDISPDFKITDASSLKAIDQEVIYSIINRYFEEKNPVFFELLDIIGAEYDEGNFAEFVLNLYEFSRQLPFPDKWFDFLAENYECEEFSKENIWYKYAFEKAEKSVSSMKSLIENAIDNLTAFEDAKNAYSGVFASAREQILTLEKALLTGEWDTFYYALQSFKLQRIPSVRGLSDILAVNSAKDVYKYLSTKASENLAKIFFADKGFINSQHNKLREPKGI